MDRLFFAIFPDADAAARAVQLAWDLKAQQGLDAKPNRQDRLHITLVHLGDFDGLPAALVEAACEAVSAVKWPSFDIELDHVISFKAAAHHRRPLVLLGREGVIPLRAFQHDLDVTLQQRGVVHTGRRSFTPHLTLSYDEDIGAAVDVTPAVRWRAAEFMLVHSFVGQSRYEVLGRWPLTPVSS